MQKNNINHPLFQERPSLLKDFLSFEQKIIYLSDFISINLHNFEIDHIAIRVNQRKDAEEWLTFLLKYGTILSDNIINGRSIYLINLQQPLYFAGQFVEVIELPFPKNKHYSVEGWEHIEIVVPFLNGETVDTWVSRVEKQFLWDKAEELHVKLDEPKSEGEKYSNPSVAISFVDKQSNHTCIKVHPYNIKKIIGAYN